MCDNCMGQPWARPGQAGQGSEGEGVWGGEGQWGEWHGWKGTWPQARRLGRSVGERGVRRGVASSQAGQ